MNQETTATNNQFDDVISTCTEIFQKKTRDYGTSWRVLRTISIADQLYIKAQRIKNVQEKKQQLVDDTIESEFIAIINYSVIGLIQLHLPESAPEELEEQEAFDLYTKQVNAAKELMKKKNHDYGEAWREMSLEGLVDLILMKLQRIRQIVSNNGKTTISEGIDANYFDIINYAVFALVLMSNPK
jgi:hypothetical protein